MGLARAQSARPERPGWHFPWRLCSLHHPPPRLSPRELPCAPIVSFPCRNSSGMSLERASMPPPCGSSTRSLRTASSVHVHSTCIGLNGFFSTPLLWRCAQVDHCGVNFFVINLPTVRDLVLPCALPFRLTAHLPALISQSRHLPPLVARPFSRNPTPIPSTRVLVPMCRSSRYDDSPAPPTSTGGRNTGVVGQRACLLCVIPRAAGCGALCGVRSASLRGSVAVSRDWRVSAGEGVRGGGGRDVVVSTRH